MQNSLPDSPPSRDHLAPQLRNRPCFLFLDFDGTLVPLADNPKDATLPPATSELLTKLSYQLGRRVAIVSARGLNVLTKECDAGKFILAGNYGLEISFPSGRTYLHPAAAQAEPFLAELRRDISELVASEPRLFVDDHRYSFCLHLHRIPLKEQEAISASIADLQQKFGSLQFRRLPTSVEIAPEVEWHKGKALDKIVGDLLLGDDELLYLAFGDSEADEPMFRWVNDRQGLSFRVSHGQKQEATTTAVRHLSGVSDVVTFLQSLLDLD